MMFTDENRVPLQINGMALYDRIGYCSNAKHGGGCDAENKADCTGYS